MSKFFGFAQLRPRTHSHGHIAATTVLLALVILACGGDPEADPDGVADASAAGEADASVAGDAPRPGVPQYAELWYSVENQLVRIELDPDDGAVVALTSSTLEAEMRSGQNLITMLDDGSLVVGRLASDDNKTYFHHIPAPPRDGSPISPVALGVMPDDLMLEGMYTDCDGRLYGMDTGVDVGSSDGNRLLRFTGDFLAGDLSYTVVSNLATATVADIDDMGPAIVDNTIIDNPGLAIDTGAIHAFNFETGSGTQVGSGGTWGIHALGDVLFTDGQARLYVLSRQAQLFELDVSNYGASEVLVTGPPTSIGQPGWSGLAGPLTECETGFVVN